MSRAVLLVPLAALLAWSQLLVQSRADTSGGTCSIEGSGTKECSAKASSGQLGVAEKKLVSDLVEWVKSREFLEDVQDSSFEVSVSPPLRLKRCCGLPPLPSPEDASPSPADMVSSDDVEPPDDRGQIKLKAAHDIRKGEVAFRVPRKAIVFRTPTAEDEIPYQGQQIGLAMLGCFLLREKAKGDESAWKDYIRTLPEKIPTHPLFLDPEIIPQLNYPPLEEEVMRLQRVVEGDYSKVTNPAGCGNPTLQEYKWGYAMAMSRLFSFGAQELGTVHAIKKLGYLEPNTAMPALVPLGDLLDHSNEPSLAWRLEKEDLVFSALRDVAAGEELTHSYGKKSNSKLISSYGFALPNNDFDGAQLFVNHSDAALFYSTWRVSIGLGEGGKEERKKLQAVAKRANNVSLTLLQELLNLPKYERGRQLEDAMAVIESTKSLNAWKGGYIDPEVIAVLTSLASTHYASFRVEPNYSQLSLLSAVLGFNPNPETACETIKNHLDEKGDRDAVAAAGRAIRARAEHLLQKGESIEEDENILKALSSCDAGNRVVKGSADAQTTEQLCTRDADWLAQYKQAVEFRKWKKEILKEVSSCCQWDCDTVASS